MSVETVRAYLSEKGYGDRVLEFTESSATVALAARRLDLAPEDPRAAGWLRGEELAAEGLAPGWTALTVSGFPLGMGKVSGGRIKNHYPKGLRNLK